MRDFEKDLKEVFEDDIKNSDKFCEELWSSLSNIEWTNKDGSIFSCSFRYAGDIISNIKEEGNYMDWYCSGDYAKVTPYIKEKLYTIGWEHKEAK